MNRRHVALTVVSSALLASLLIIVPRLTCAQSSELPDRPDLAGVPPAPPMVLPMAPAMMSDVMDLHGLSMLDIGDGSGGGQHAAGQARDTKRREMLRQRIQKIKYDRMKKYVAMDDATWKQFLKVYQPAESEIASIVKERDQEVQKLKLLADGAGHDEDVDPQMEKIHQLNLKIDARVLKLNDELKPVISPRQRARLILFSRQFNLRVREALDRHRAGRDWKGKDRPWQRRQDRRPQGGEMQQGTHPPPPQQ